MEITFPGRNTPRSSRISSALSRRSLSNPLQTAMGVCARLCLLQFFAKVCERRREIRVAWLYSQCARWVAFVGIVCKSEVSQVSIRNAPLPLTSLRSGFLDRDFRPAVANGRAQNCHGTPAAQKWWDCFRIARDSGGIGIQKQRSAVSGIAQFRGCPRFLNDRRGVGEDAAQSPPQIFQLAVDDPDLLSAKGGQHKAIEPLVIRSAVIAEQAQSLFLADEKAVDAI